MKGRRRVSAATGRPEAGRLVLTATREELTRADAKATALFAGVGVALGAILSGLLAGQWSPLRLHGSAAPVLWWAGASCAVAALTMLAAALYPRTRARHDRAGVVAYYGDVVRLGPAELTRALTGTDTAPLVDQVRVLSAIVARKYALIKAAFPLLAAAAVLCGAAVLLDLLVRTG